MKHSMATVTPAFSADRMVRDYCQEIYRLASAPH